MDDEIALPCTQALLAGTMALMTAFANPDFAGAPGTGRGSNGRATEGVPGLGFDAPGHDARLLLLARKVVSNLFFLREHPGLDDGLRQVATRLHTHWSALARRLEGARSESPPPAGSAESGPETRPASVVLH